MNTSRPGEFVGTVDGGDGSNAGWWLQALLYYRPSSVLRSGVTAYTIVHGVGNDRIQ